MLIFYRGETTNLILHFTFEQRNAAWETILFRLSSGLSGFSTDFPIPGSELVRDYVVLRNPMANFLANPRIPMRKLLGSPLSGKREVSKAKVKSNPGGRLIDRLSSGARRGHQTGGETGRFPASMSLSAHEPPGYRDAYSWRRWPGSKESWRTSQEDSNTKAPREQRCGRKLDASGAPRVCHS